MQGVIQMITISSVWERAHRPRLPVLVVSDFLESRVLAFDVGGSHVAAAVCSTADFSLGPVASAPHATVSTSDDFLDLLHSLGMKARIGRERVIGTMLAVPGPFDLQAGVSLMRHKLPYLYGVDLRLGLAERFQFVPAQVRFLNDADAYLLGEIGAGAARSFSRAVGLTLGTGIGSAFAVNGDLVTEGPGVPSGGEIWNLPYQGGIVEDFISSRAIVGNYERCTGKKREVVDLADTAQSDPAAQQAFSEFGHHLGAVIRTLLAEFNADVIVLGGGISRSANLFLPTVQAEIGDSTIELRVSELKDTAALVGCGVAAFRTATGSPDPGKSASTQNAAV